MRRAENGAQSLGRRVWGRRGRPCWGAGTPAMLAQETPPEAVEGRGGLGEGLRPFAPLCVVVSSVFVRKGARRSPLGLREGPPSFCCVPTIPHPIGGVPLLVGAAARVCPAPTPLPGPPAPLWGETTSPWDPGQRACVPRAAPKGHVAVCSSEGAEIKRLFSQWERSQGGRGRPGVKARPLLCRRTGLGGSCTRRPPAPGPRHIGAAVGTRLGAPCT